MSLQPVYLFTNPQKMRALMEAQQVVQLLRDAGVPVLCEPALAPTLKGAEPLPLSALTKDTAALIAIGGDGTLLLAAPHAAMANVPMLGIHTGTVGFLMETDTAGVRAAIEKLLNGRYTLDSRSMLSCAVNDGAPALALNDCAVTRGEHPGVLPIAVAADGFPVYRLTGDGVLISTPTGSTAYALSAGAPMLRPDCACHLITPVCAREMLARPVLVPDSAIITLSIEAQGGRKPLLSLDGQHAALLKDKDVLTIRKAPCRARFIRFETHDFFEQLRIKQAYWNQL